MVQLEGIFSVYISSFSTFHIFKCIGFVFFFVFKWKKTDKGFWKERVSQTGSSSSIQDLGHQGRASTICRTARCPSPGRQGVAWWPEQGAAAVTCIWISCGAWGHGRCQSPTSRDLNLVGLRWYPRTGIFNSYSTWDSNSHQNLRTLRLEPGINEAKVPDWIPKGLPELAACVPAGFWPMHCHMSNQGWASSRHEWKRAHYLLSSLHSPPLHALLNKYSQTHVLYYWWVSNSTFARL